MSKDNAARRNVFMIDPDDIVVIGHDTEDGPEHHLYDPRIKLPLDEAMVLNVQTYGVLEPIICQTDADRTLVVDGRRRVLHAREAKKRQKKAGEELVKIPVWFKKGEDRYLFGVSRSANAHRVNDGPMTNARNAQRMIDMGSSEEEVAVAFGVTPATVRMWCDLLGLAPKVKTAVEKGELGTQAAHALTRLSREEQVAHLDKLREEGVKPTADNVANRVRAAQGKPAILTPKQRLTRATKVIERLITLEAQNGLLTHDELTEALHEITKHVVGASYDKMLKGASREQAQVPEGE